LKRLRVTGLKVKSQEFKEWGTGAGRKLEGRNWGTETRRQKLESGKWKAELESRNEKWGRERRKS